MKCCIKNCCDVCSEVNVSELIYKINYEISNLSIAYINFIKYGYECKKNIPFLINKLDSQKWVLENLYKFKNCFCEEDINIIKEDVSYNINCSIEARKDLVVDSSQKATWDKHHPYCISRESWEALAYKVCGDLSIDVSIKEMCNLTYDIYVRNISCDFIAGLSVYSTSCQFDFQKDVYSKQQCKYHFNKLVKTNKNCDLTLSKYSKLINKCNMKPNLISYGYSCGFKFDIDGECPVIKSQKNKYNLCELKFNKILYDVKCELMNEKPNIKSILKEYKIN